jgi:glutamine---fructose-6-phosphate transaminase (isomerizing)
MFPGKPISCIHAEGHIAGELKHGQLARIDEEMPVIAVVPTNGLLEGQIACFPP